MTEQAMNVAIAEIMGIQTVYFAAPYDCHGHPETYVTKTRKDAEDWHWRSGEVYEFVDYSRFPNYTSDLNAVHEVILRLDNTVNLITGDKGLQTRRDRYMDMLERIVEPTCAEDEIEFYAMNATATQCSQALLRAYEMWVEE